MRCRSKLLVLSGPAEQPEQPSAEEELEESISFDEHLLERISVLEEAVKRTSETLRQVLAAVDKQERLILVNQTTVATLRELLEHKEILGAEEWRGLWETRMDHQLLALEKRERFLALKERIVALHRGDDRDQFVERLERAEDALVVFDVATAMATLEEAFELDRSNYELAAFLGEAWFNEGDPERAQRYFDDTLAERDDHYEGLVYGGVLRHEQGDDAGAVELLERAVELYPESFLPLFSLGAIQAGRDHLEEAAGYLGRAVVIDPVPQALYLLGSCQHQMGRLQRAINTLKEAVRRDPGFEEAYHLLGLAMLDRRWNRKALEAFRRAHELNPKRLEYHDLVRFLEGEEGTPLPAVAGKAGGWLEQGEEARHRGRSREALDAYRKALRLDPDNPTLLISYALLCLHLDRQQEIETLTRRVLEQEPGEMLRATAYAALIEALRGQGRYREGNRAGERLLEEGESNFSKTIAYYELACNLAEMEEDLEAALSYAHRSLECAPEELKAFPLAALGWVHYKRREFDKAVDFLLRSSELAASTTTLTHLGMALLASGQEEQARSVLARAHSMESSAEDLGERMMQVMKESSRLLERVRSRQRKSTTG